MLNVKGKDEFSRVVKGLQYMANCMSILRTFKCIEPSKCVNLNRYCLIFLLVLFHFITNHK